MKTAQINSSQINNRQHLKFINPEFQRNPALTNCSDHIIYFNNLSCFTIIINQSITIINTKPWGSGIPVWKYVEVQRDLIYIYINHEDFIFIL